MFHLGRRDKVKLFFLTVILSTIIAALTQCTGVSKNALWDLLDEIQRTYFPQSILNELILQDPNKVERRVNRDVDRAIDEYWEKSKLSRVEVPQPRYIEEENDESVCYTDECKALAPSMRLCAPWVEDCPK